MQNNDVISEERVYAGFFVRLAAFMLDWLIVGAALLVVKIPIWISAIVGGGSILMEDLIFKYSVYDIFIYLLKVVYFVLLTYHTGATLGKKLMNIAVVSEEDRKPTLFEIIYRESVGKFLSGLIMSVGYIIIGLDKKKRGLHDHLADTCVIYRHKKSVYVAAPVVVQKKPFISTQMSGQDTQVSAQVPNTSAQNVQMPGQNPYPTAQGPEENNILEQQMVLESLRDPEKTVPEAVSEEKNLTNVESVTDADPVTNMDSEYDLQDRE